MKFFKRLLKAYRMVKAEEESVDYQIATLNAEEVKEPTFGELAKKLREEEAAAIRAIQDYEEYR